MLEYVTRGHTSAVGKDKVFFVSHPEEQTEYFEYVKKILFHRQNLALFYEDGQGEPENWWEEEYGIQLVVVAVTRRFCLEENNEGRKMLDMAKKYHIPVCPIAFERGILPLFDEKIGSYQCLFAGTQEETEKNFYQKLNDFLSQVMDDEQMNEMIRKNAFDFNLFISYRKKNRGYVNQLTKIMHDRTELRGISYWYDEDLMPGLDYNEEIDQAIKESDAVVLIITPSIIEEDNYVKRIEYQQANAYGKKIIPFMFEDTDMDALREGFPGIQIQDVIRKEDIGRYFDYLEAEVYSRRMGEIGVNQSYYLGLAYLKGVGVEKNRRWGIEFLTVASQSGVPAMKKLVEVYSSTRGTKGDRQKAIYWQSILVQERKRLFEEKQDRESLLDFLHSIYVWGTLHQEDENYQQAIELFRDFMRISKQYNLASEDMIRVCMELYKYCHIAGEEETAASYLYQIIELVAGCVEARGYFGELESRALYFAYIGSGDIMKEQGRYDKAGQCYQLAYNRAEDNGKKFETMDTLSDLAEVNSRLGLLLETVGKEFQNAAYLRKASGYLVEAAERLRQVYKETMTVHNLLNLRQNFMDAGRICYEVSDYETAGGYLQETIETCDTLREQFPDISYTVFYTNYAPGMEQVYGYLAQIYKMNGAMENAALFEKMSEWIAKYTQLN